MNNAKKGFTFPYGRKDVFVETAYRNKTDTLADKILKAMVNVGIDIPNNPDVRKEVLWYLRKATCEEVPSEKWGKYYKLNGENFGSICFADDVIIIKLSY